MMVSRDSSSYFAIFLRQNVYIRFRRYNNNTDSAMMTLIIIITLARRSYVMSVGVRLKTKSIIKVCNKAYKQVPVGLLSKIFPTRDLDFIFGLK